MPRQQGVQGGGEGEDVAGLRGRRRRERLRGRIGGRHPQRVRGRCFVAHEGRQAEVRQSRSTEAVDQDVRRFHIAVQHSARVQAGQRVGDSQPHPPDLFLGADVLGNQPRGQRPTRAQLHDQVRSGVREQTGVIDGDDTGMIGQPAGDARLPGERLVDTRGQSRSIDLDRDGTGQQLLAGLPDQGEATTREWDPAAQPTDRRMLHAQTPVSRLGAYPHTPIHTLNL